MQKIIFILPLFLLLTGCTVPEVPVVDQCLRKQYFDDCLKNSPAGQEGIKYNDWHEVVNTCDEIALYQSFRSRHSVKPECKR